MRSMATPAELRPQRGYHDKPTSVNAKPETSKLTNFPPFMPMKPMSVTCNTGLTPASSAQCGGATLTSAPRPYLGQVSDAKINNSPRPFKNCHQPGVGDFLTPAEVD